MCLLQVHLGLETLQSHLKIDNVSWQRKPSESVPCHRSCFLKMDDDVIIFTIRYFIWKVLIVLHVYYVQHYQGV